MSSLTAPLLPSLRSRSVPAPWTVARFAIGLLLLAAASLKALWPEEAATLRVGYNIPAWALAVVVQAEFALGLALLSNWRPALTRRAGLAAFTLFAGFAAYRVALGAESCGCFGDLKVNPWWTLGLDLVVLAALAFVRPIEPETRIGHRLLLASCLMLGLPVLIAMLGATSSSAAANPLLQDIGGITLLEPEDWAGRAFPLTEEISPAAPIATGDWTVMLYHHDCPHCQAALPQYQRLAAAGSAVLLVEVPPYGPSSQHTLSTAHHARLSDDRKWFVQAPVEIQLTDGVVTHASLDLPSIPNAGH